MSFRNWLPYVAAGIGIGVVLSLLVAFALHNYQRASECSYYSAEPHCQNATEDSPSVRLTPPQRDYRPSPDPYPERKEWREERDLQAQGKMAEWAFWAVVAAFVSVFVTGIGVVLVAFTLEASRDAVTAANRTANEAKRIGEAQVRAYLSCEGAKYTVDSHWFSCHVTIRNHGQSPAIWTEITGGMTIIKEGVSGKGAVVSTRKNSTPGPTVAAGQPAEIFLVWTHADMGDGGHKAIWERTGIFDLTCRLDWEDVFGEKHSSSFWLGAEIKGDTYFFSKDERRGTLTAFNSATPTHRNKQ